MSPSSIQPQLPPPRVALVLAGAAGAVGRAATALEHAAMPQLAALAATGRVGRLRTVASHLPVDGAASAAAMLGTIPPMAIDPGAIAIESLGRALAADESCTVVEVLDLFGDPAPALDVERAADTLAHQLRWQRIAGRSGTHRILVAGAVPPVLPQLEGLELRASAAGFLPARQLTASTVMIATEGSVSLGVAGLLGAGVRGVDAARAERRDPVPARLRAQAVAALIDGAHTVVVETRTPLLARRGRRDDAARERAVCAVLEQLDRELVAPLRAAAGWVGATISVTADLPRASDGEPLRGEVPIVMSGPRHVFLTEPGPILAPLGTSLPPAYCERSVAGLPVVSSPFHPLPAAEPGTARRFSRDPTTGRTFAGGRAAA